MKKTFRVMTSEELSMSAERAMLGDTNDCAVRAVALATRLPYRDVQARLAAEGRRFRCGTYSNQYIAAMRKAGFVVTNVPFRPCTTKTVASQFRHGTYLVRVRRHVYCVRDGVALDGEVLGLNRVKEVLKVSPADAVVEVPPPQVPVAPPAARVHWTTLCAELRYGKQSVAELASMFGTSEKMIRNAIDGARRNGRDIVNLGGGVFELRLPV